MLIWLFLPQKQWFWTSFRLTWENPRRLRRMYADQLPSLLEHKSVFSHRWCSCVCAAHCVRYPRSDLLELFTPCPYLTPISKVLRRAALVMHIKYLLTCVLTHKHSNTCAPPPTHTSMHTEKKTSMHTYSQISPSYIMPSLASPREDVEFYTAIHRSPNSLVQMSIYAEHTLFLQACFMCLCGVLQPHKTRPPSPR